MPTNRKVGKDTMGATIVACMRLENSLGMDVHTRAGFAAIVMVQLCTFMIQCVIAIIFDVTFATPTLNRYSPATANLVMAAVRTAMATTPPGSIGLNQRTCISQRSHPWLGYMMMFMWFGLMVKQILDNLLLVKMIIEFPTLKPKKEKEPGAAPVAKEPALNYDFQSYDKMGKGPDKVNHMAFPWKLFVLLFILLPHLMLAAYMTMVGMKFLAATGDPGRLILKAMALKFVLGMDKIFYSAFASEQLQTYVKKCKYEWQRPKEANYFNAWISTVFKLCMVLMLTGFAWSRYPHLLQLRSACGSYMDASAKCIGNSCGVTWLQMLKGALPR